MLDIAEVDSGAQVCALPTKAALNDVAWHPSKYLVSSEAPDQCRKNILSIFRGIILKFTKFPPEQLAYAGDDKDQHDPKKVREENFSRSRSRLENPPELNRPQENSR